MSILTNSRLFGRQIFRYDDPLTGVPVELVDRLVFLGDVAGPKARLYTVQGGDVIDKIAHDHYGNSRWWWIIALANTLFWPLDLTVGQQLVIPDLEHFWGIVYPRMARGAER